jgi:hypothetical protein
VGLRLSQIDEADELLTRTPKGSLASLAIVWVPDPLALLIGMVLDQPVSEGWSGVGRSKSI